MSSSATVSLMNCSTSSAASLSGSELDSSSSSSSSSSSASTEKKDRPVTLSTVRSISSCSSSSVAYECLSTPSTPDCALIPYSSAAISSYLTPGLSLIPTFPVQAAAINTLYLTPASWKQHYGMEAVWIREFRALFSHFLPHIWAIQPVACSPTGGNNLMCFVDSAKVRFSCDVCGHGWTSMKGRVAFWFDLMMSYGIVAFKLYGQMCDRCKDQRYESSMWYPEEVQKVLINLYNRVGQAYYGFDRPIIEKNRRPGKPRTPHLGGAFCQACCDGLCDRK